MPKTAWAWDRQAKIKAPRCLVMLDHRADLDLAPLHQHVNETDRVVFGFRSPCIVTDTLCVSATPS